MAFIEKLKHRLTKPLPGLEAQSLMFPGKSRALPNQQQLQGARQAAICVLLFLKKDKWHTTLIQRVDYKGVHGGQMAFPGGKKELDESFIETALRETEEEIGVTIDENQVLGKLSPVYIPPSNMYVEPILASIGYIPKYILQEREVAKVVELELSTLLDDDIRKVKTITHTSGHTLKTPYFDVLGHMVWGATAVMLSELAVIIEDVYKQ